METSTKVREVMATALEVDLSRLPSDASIDTVESWDSLHHMNLVLSLEKAFGIKFEEDEVTELLSFHDIVGAVNKRIKVQ